jgi:hypothetical protein
MPVVEDYGGAEEHSCAPEVTLVGLEGSNAGGNGGTKTPPNGRGQ